MNDPHQILGVAKTASAAEVRVAYRAFAAQHHPDRGGDPAFFIAGQDAYRQLSGASSTSAAADVELRFHRRSSISGRARRAASAVSSAARRVARQPVRPPRVR